MQVPSLPLATTISEQYSYTPYLTPTPSNVLKSCPPTTDLQWGSTSLTPTYYAGLQKKYHNNSKMGIFDYFILFSFLFYDFYENN